jgi:hypothetical protein
MINPTCSIELTSSVSLVHVEAGASQTSSRSPRSKVYSTGTNHHLCMLHTAEKSLFQPPLSQQLVLSATIHPTPIYADHPQDQTKVQEFISLLETTHRQSPAATRLTTQLLVFIEDMYT